MSQEEPSSTLAFLPHLGWSSASLHSLIHITEGVDEEIAGLSEEPYFIITKFQGVGSK